MIVTDEDILRTKCVDVEKNEISELIAKLEDELRLSAERGFPGIGLSAPQIGISSNCAIVRVSTGLSLIKVNLVNATIKQGYNLVKFKNEGCLSFPDKHFDTMRYDEIHVINNAVKPNKFIATGLLSVCIQHELDHLSGKLLIDWK